LAGFIDQITALLLTYNEAPNIERALRALSWVRKIVVVDSGSTDGTLEILAQDPRVRILQRPFDSFARQCRYGLEAGGIDTPWVLSLDADHIVTDNLVSELQSLTHVEGIAAYEAEFTYCVFGRPLRGSLYPPRVVLFRREYGHYVDDGHGHRIVASGQVGRLHGRILHDDRKPLGRWLASQDRYMRLEARKLLTSPRTELNLADKIRRFVVVAPLLAPLWCLFVKGGLLDGWLGVYYAMQRGVAEAILSLRLIEAKITGLHEEEQ